MHVEIRDEARDDLVDGAIFYGEQSPDLDQYCLKCLRDDIEKLQSTGGIHEQYHGDLVMAAVLAASRRARAQSRSDGARNRNRNQP